MNGFLPPQRLCSSCCPPANAAKISQVYFNIRKPGTVLFDKQSFGSKSDDLDPACPSTAMIQRCSSNHFCVWELQSYPASIKVCRILLRGFLFAQGFTIFTRRIGAHLHKGHKLLFHISNAKISSGMNICWPCQAAPSWLWQDNCLFHLLWLPACHEIRCWSCIGHSRCRSPVLGTARVVSIDCIACAHGEGLQLFPQWWGNGVRKWLSPVLVQGSWQPSWTVKCNNLNTFTNAWKRKSSKTSSLVGYGGMSNTSSRFSQWGYLQPLIRTSASGTCACAADSHTCNKVTKPTKTKKLILSSFAWTLATKLGSYQINSGWAGWARSADSKANAAQTLQDNEIMIFEDQVTRHDMERHGKTWSTSWATEQLHRRQVTSDSRRPSRSISQRFNGGLREHGPHRPWCQQFQERS